MIIFRKRVMLKINYIRYYVRYSNNLSYLLTPGKHFGDEVKLRRRMKRKVMYFLFIQIFIPLFIHSLPKKKKKKKHISSHAVFKIIRFLERRRRSCIFLLILLIQVILQELLFQHDSTLYDKKCVKQPLLGCTSSAWAQENKWTACPWEFYSHLYTRMGS